jgi:hypothetical protein
VQSLTCICSECSSSSVLASSFRFNHAGQLSALIAPDADVSAVDSALEVCLAFLAFLYLPSPIILSQYEVLPCVAQNVGAQYH